VVLVAVVGGPTVLDGVVTPGRGVVALVVGEVAPAVAGVVLAVAGPVVTAVEVVLAAAADEEVADFAPFEPVEQPDAVNATTIATRSAHLRTRDLMVLNPILSDRYRQQPKMSSPSMDLSCAEDRARESSCIAVIPRFRSKQTQR
jgi:hypothetical protein